MATPRGQSLIQRQTQPAAKLSTARQREIQSAKRAREFALAKAKGEQRVADIKAKQVNYEAAWGEALSHFNKGRGGAYVFHMKKEAATNPKIAAVRGYIQGLIKQQRAGNISPSETMLSQVKRDIAKQQIKPDFSKVEKGKITYSPEFNTYYTRDKTGKVIVTSGDRGYDYLVEGMSGGTFEKPKITRPTYIRQQDILPQQSFDVTNDIADIRVQKRINGRGQNGMSAREFQERLRQVSGQPSQLPGVSRFIPERKPQPLSIQASRQGDFGLGATRYKQPYWESTKQAFGKLKKGKPSEFFDPFLYSEDIKAKKLAQKKEVTFQEPQFGTINMEFPTGYQEITIPVRTYGDIQKERENKRDEEISKEREKIDKRVDKVFNQLQSSVDSGKLSVEDAQKQLEAYSEQVTNELNRKATNIYSKYPDVPGVFERENRVKRYGIIGADVAGYSLATALAGPMGAVGYGTARGVGLAAKGAPKDIRSGMELYSGIAELSPESKEAGLHLLSVPFSGVSATGKIAKEIDIARLQQARQAQARTLGKIYDVDKEKWIKAVTKKKTPYFESQLFVDAPVFQKSKTDFILGANKAKQKARFLPFSQQVGDSGWQLIEKEAIIGARSKVAPALIEGLEIPKTFGTYGRGYVQPLKSTKGTSYFDFGGVTTDMGEYLTGRGGRAVSKRIYPELADDILYGTKKSQKIIEKSVRLSPEQYAKERFGSRFFETDAMPDDVLGVFMRPVRKQAKKGILPEIKIKKGLTGKQRQEVIAHELIHSKTPGVIYAGDFLPYRVRPSELIAFGLEKQVAKKGLKSTAFEAIDIADDFIEIPLKTRLKVSPKDTSVIFKKVPQVADDFGLTITRTGGKKSSKQYLQSLSQQQAAEASFSDFSATVAEDITRGMTTTLVPTKKSIPTVIAKPRSAQIQQEDMFNEFLGVSSRKIKQQIKPVVTPKKKSKKAISPRSRNIPAQLISPYSGVDVVQRSLSATKTKQKSITRQKQAMSQITPPALDFGFGFGFGIPTPSFGLTPGFDFPERRRQYKKIISKPKPSKKKRRKFISSITGFEAALGLGPRYVEKGKRFTGFEAVRGRNVRKPVRRKQPKKTKRKRQPRRRDELSRYLY